MHMHAQHAKRKQRAQHADTCPAWPHSWLTDTRKATHLVMHRVHLHQGLLQLCLLLRLLLG